MPGTHTGLCQKLQRCWGFHAQQFPVCIKNGPPPKGHPANLTQPWEAFESTWGSITVPRCIDAVLKAKSRGATQYQEGVPNFLYTQCTWNIFIVY